jgi:hypothetical protein
VNAVVMLLVLLSGCYRSHGPGETGARDGGRDAPTDRFDAGRDAPTDRFDAGRDAPLDRFDGGLDAGLDAGRDAGMDAGVDGGPRDGGPRDGGSPIDGGPFDAGRRDGGRDAGTDAGRRTIALRFERTTTMTVADAESLNLTRECTLEMWIRARSGDDGIVLAKGDLSADRYHDYVALEAGDVVVGYRTAAGARLLRTPLPRDAWHHVAWTYADAGDGTAVAALLLDGAVVSTGSIPADILDATNDQALVFGRSAVDLDEVRLWIFARDARTIASAMSRRVPSSSPGLEMYLALEEAGQIAFDRSLHGHEGVLGLFTVEDPADPEWIMDGVI